MQFTRENMKRLFLIALLSISPCFAGFTSVSQYGDMTQINSPEGMYTVNHYGYLDQVNGPNGYSGTGIDLGYGYNYYDNN